MTNLANSRPYEGVILRVALAPSIWAWHSKARLRTILPPFVLILGVTATAMGYYCSRFSGNHLLLPYSLYRSAFTMAPHFVWQSPRPEPVYYHRVLRDFYTGWEMAAYADARANRPPRGLFDKAKSYWRFYFGPALTIPLVTIPWLWKRRRARWLLLALVLFSAGLAVEVWHAPHYAAPALGLALLAVVEALRHLRLCRWRGKRVGTLLVSAVFLGGVIYPPYRAATAGHGEERARILNQLEATGERHLVIVRYRLNHDPGNEWVYNSADIDNARVVWAREMDPTSNRTLLRYFNGRDVRLVEPDATPARLSPYNPALPPDPPFRFVRLGAEAVEVLRNPEEIRQKILDKVAGLYDQPYRLSCDQWNFFFTEITGVEAPESANGCFAQGGRGQTIGFDDWFGWIEKQR